MDLNLNNFPLLNADIGDISALWKLRLIGGSEVQAIASDLLSHGISADQLIKILVSSTDDKEDIAHQFDSFLSDRGLFFKSHRDALRRLARKVSASIVSGAVPPGDGAKFLWDASLKSKDSEFHELDTFIYAASEITDRTGDRAFFEKAIFDEATRWSSLP